MDAVARFLVRRPGIVLAAIAAATVLLGWQALGLRIESSLESVLPAGDPRVREYMEVRETFGGDDVAVVGVHGEEVFRPQTLAKIDRLTEKISEIDGVERVLSITNTVDPAADVFDPPPLVPQIPLRPGQVEALREKLASTTLYRENLVAPDFQGAAINVFFEDLTDVEYADLRIDERIESLIAAEEGPEEIWYTGAGHLKQVAVDLMRRDLFRFTPIALLLVLVVLGLSFRSAIGIFLPMLSVVVALVWTLGVMAWMGKAITLGTFVLPPLLLVIGSAYGIHVMTRHYHESRAGRSSSEIAEATFRRVWIPVSISALTTIVGFGSLMVNRILAVRDLGFFSVVGLVFLLITSLGMMPAALQLVGREPAGGENGGRESAGRISRFLARCGDRSFAHRHKVLAVSLAVGLAAVWGAQRIRVDSDFIGYFDPESEVRTDNRSINEEIVGTNPFYLIVEGREPGALQSWQTLRLIKDLQEFLATLPGITSSISLVDYLELLETGLQESGSGDIIIDEQGRIVATKPKPFWEDRGNLAPVLELVEQSPDTFSGVVTEDFSRGSILVRTRLTGSRRIETTLDRIRAYIDQHFPERIRVNATGNLVLLTGTTSDIVAGQVNSLLLALAVIFVVMSLMFLSLRVGALAIVPNMLPIAIFFGVMGWGGIDLNLGTSLIAAIALGIAVDSTIHYMTRLNFELKGETDQQSALIRTTESVGEPIVYSTVALLLGFLVFAFSAFIPIRSFGILSTITMATALGTNLGLLPALLATTKIITLWDLVGVRLGEDPTSTIPLFSGLRPAQARIVVLMGEIRRFAPGEAIIRRGELGSEMYVLIRGCTEVWAGSGEDRRRVVELRRGDVFGEMALVRHDERSADVIAAEEVEAFAVDERFLQRIQRRYPRIASKVFLNLTRILSDRLQRTTEQFVSAR